MILDKKFHGEYRPRRTLETAAPGGALTLSSRRCRDPRPRRRSPDHIRRAAGGQNVRGSLGDHSEHEQSGGLALQQSQEVDIGEQSRRSEGKGAVFLLSVLHSMCFFPFPLSDSERLVSSAMEELCVSDRRRATSEQSDNMRSSSAESHKLQPDRIPPSDSPPPPQWTMTSLLSFVLFVFSSFFF